MELKKGDRVQVRENANLTQKEIERINGHKVIQVYGDRSVLVNGLTVDNEYLEPYKPAEVAVPQQKRVLQKGSRVQVRKGTDLTEKVIERINGYIIDHVYDDTIAIINGFHIDMEYLEPYLPETKVELKEGDKVRVGGDFAFPKKVVNKVNGQIIAGIEGGMATLQNRHEVLLRQLRPYESTEEPVSQKKKVLKQWDRVQVRKGTDLAESVVKKIKGFYIDHLYEGTGDAIVNGCHLNIECLEPFEEPLIVLREGDKVQVNEYEFVPDKHKEKINGQTIAIISSNKVILSNNHEVYLSWLKLYEAAEPTTQMELQKGDRVQVRKDMGLSEMEIKAIDGHTIDHIRDDDNIVVVNGYFMVEWLLEPYEPKEVEETPVELPVPQKKISLQKGDKVQVRKDLGLYGMDIKAINGHTIDHICEADKSDNYVLVNGGKIAIWLLEPYEPLEVKQIGLVVGDKVQVRKDLDLAERELDGINEYAIGRIDGYTIEKLYNDMAKVNGFHVPVGYLEPYEPKEVIVEETVKSERPPLGLMTKKQHAIRRCNAIYDAITKYHDAGKKIPIEWVEEYNELTD